jgi:hypothetical protein
MAHVRSRTNSRGDGFLGQIRRNSQWQAMPVLTPFGLAARNDDAAQQSNRC